MNYEEAVKFIESAQTFGCVLELENTTELLRLMGNPQDGLKYIHIAGTNGKGSVAAYLAYIIAAAGYRVGRYNSPAVFDFCERISFTEKVNGKISCQNIKREHVAKHTAKIKEGVLDMTGRGMYHPTCFELETTLAFMEFKKMECDYVILEVGLGGRYDATNIIKKPICTVITSISLDHCSVLGDTIDKIAGEKAGIIKKNVPVVVYDQEVSPELSLPVIKKEAEEKKAEFIKTDFNNIKNVDYSLEGTCFDFEGFKEIKIKLLGKNQVKNAALALKTIETLVKKNVIDLADSSVYEGMEKAEWAGRFEIIGKSPLMIIDGAHNADAANALRESIELYLKGKPLVFVMGVFGDKDYEGILKRTAYLAEHIITINAKGARTLDKNELARCAKKYTKAEIHGAGSVKKGICLAKELCGEKGAVIAFGSLSFLGDVYELYKENGRKKPDKPESEIIDKNR